METNLQAFQKRISAVLKTVALFSIVASGLMLVIPLFTLQVLDRVISTRSIDTLLVLSVGAIGVLLIIALINLIRERIMINVANDLNAELWPEIFRAVIKDNALKAKHDKGDVLNQLQQVKHFLTSSAFFNLFELPWIPLFVVILFSFNATLGGIVLASIAAMLILSFVGELISRPRHDDASKLHVANRNNLDSYLRNAETIEAMGMSSQVEQLYFDQQQSLRQKEIRSESLLASLHSMARLVRMSLNVLLTAVGGWLVVDGQITTGVMIAGLIIGIKAVSPMENIMGNWKSLMLARQLYNQLKQNLSAAEYERSNHAISVVPVGDLTISNLVYVPASSNKAVIRGINYQVKAGSVLGITGPNGSGKSTFLKLAMGLLKPTSGHVQINDLEVSQLNRELFGYHIGYLKQDTALFPGTVAENISRLQPAAIDEIIRAAKMAGAHDLIMSLPQGYDTPLYDGGLNLSGGQRQMIAIARALFGDPRLVILDEPTAMLDLDETEQVAGMLKRLRQAGITTIVVSHQSRLLKEANDVLVIRQGAVDSLKTLKVA